MLSMRAKGLRVGIHNRIRFFIVLARLEARIPARETEDINFRSEDVRIPHIADE